MAVDAVAALRAAIRIPTISAEDPTSFDSASFDKLGVLLETTFPLVHANLDLELFDHSRLYHWPGANPDTVSALLLAHQDVVPADPDGWTHPPFAGELADGYIWGRGAIDDKSRLVAILTAAENALAQGFTPRGSVFFAFGHDEELGGLNGAQHMATALAERGIRADLVLDEGGIIGDGLVTGISKPVATIMLGEKGFVTIRLSTTDPGGHASLPPKMTAVGRIAKAVNAIQNSPFPLRLTPTVRDMLERLTPQMSAPRRAALLAAQHVSPIATRLMAQQAETEALVRTTTAPTVIRGGIKANVLPQSAEALINFRILSPDTVSSVLAHCRKVVDDERVAVEIAPGMVAEPSPDASGDDPQFARVAEIVRDLVPEAVITSGIVTGATDSRYYAKVADYRINFAPITLTRADISGIHGTDERISLSNLTRLVEFNEALLRTC